MPLHKPSMLSTSVECMEGSVFMIPSSKRSQSPIIFGRAKLRRSTVTDSSSDSEPPQFFHYAWSAQHMTRKIGYSLQRGSGLNFRKGWCDFLCNFVLKGKPAKYYDKTRSGLGYVTPSPSTSFRSEDNKPIPSCSASSSEWESDISVGMIFKNLSINMTSSNQLEPGGAIDVEPWAQQLDFQWEKQFEQREPSTEDKVL